MLYFLHSPLFQGVGNKPRQVALARLFRIRRFRNPIMPLASRAMWM